MNGRDPANRKYRKTINLLMSVRALCRVLDFSGDKPWCSLSPLSVGWATWWASYWRQQFCPLPSLERRQSLVL